jgi:glycosyltransferase involved in cell wall biosynthesis
MRIIHLNSSDLKGGGAAIAANRLHNALRNEGIDSKMFVKEKTTNDEHVIESNLSIPHKLIGKVYGKIRKNYKHQGFVSDYLPSPGIVNQVKQLKPDLIHLHYIANKFISPAILKQFDVPLVWTLHDVWPLTGGCHYVPPGCEKFKSQCGNCPVINKNIEKDPSYRQFNLKKLVYKKHPKIVFISPSKYFKDLGDDSALLQQHTIRVVPNGIQTNIFTPITKQEARENLKLEPNKKYVAVGANAILDDTRKGFHFLAEALGKINDPNIHLLIFGSDRKKAEVPENVSYTILGIVKSQVTLRDIYAAADVVAVPSKRETFGLTAAEAMASGTSVVAFDTTGLKDIITHKEDGYLAKPFDTSDYAKGIQFVLEHGDSLHSKARTKIVNEYKMDLVAKEHITVYQEIIK